MTPNGTPFIVKKTRLPPPRGPQRNPRQVRRVLDGRGKGGAEPDRIPARGGEDLSESLQKGPEREGMGRRRRRRRRGGTTAGSSSGSAPQAGDANRYSEPAKQLQECRSKMQNQSSQMEAQIVSLGRRMEETQEAAKNQAGIWSHQMETMNKSLTETQENWHSCQKQLTALQDNFTSTEAKERSQTEAIKNLQQQLTEKSKQLNDEERKSQEERKHHEAEIQQLRERLAQKQQDDSNGAGGSRDFAGLSITLLTILMAGFLSV